jgi:hypothetical protein
VSARPSPSTSSMAETVAPAGMVTPFAAQPGPVAAPLAGTPLVGASASSKSASESAPEPAPGVDVPDGVVLVGVGVDDAVDVAEGVAASSTESDDGVHPASVRPRARTKAAVATERVFITSSLPARPDGVDAARSRLDCHLMRTGITFTSYEEVIASVPRLRRSVKKPL